MFSLGSTLSAALGYDMEPETEVELGVDLRGLLEQMQEEKPGDRPCIKVWKIHNHFMFPNIAFCNSFFYIFLLLY